MRVRPLSDSRPYPSTPKEHFLEPTVRGVRLSSFAAGTGLSVTRGATTRVAGCGSLMLRIVSSTPIQEYLDTAILQRPTLNKVVPSID